MSEFTTSLDAEKADLVEAEKRLSASVESQAASKTVASKWLPSTRLREGFVGDKSVGRCDAGAPDGDGWS